MYDRAPDNWSRGPGLPTARSGIAAASLGGRIYVFGGEGNEGTFDENEAYAPQTNTWETLDPMPTARHGLGAAVVGDTIYVIGGGPDARPLRLRRQRSVYALTQLLRVRTTRLSAHGEALVR